MNIINTKSIHQLAMFFAVAFILLSPFTAAAWVDPEIKDFSIDCDQSENVHADLYSVTYYKLVDRSTNDVIEEWEDRTQPEHEILSVKFDLEDGDYRLYVENYDGDVIKKDFTVDCDQPEPELDLVQECKNEDGAITVTAPNGLDSWELFYIETSATNSIKSGTNVAAGTVDELDDLELDDGNYRFEGTLGNNFETLSFSVDCDKDEPEVPVCPFTDSGENEWVFDNFTDDRLFGENYKNPNEETNPLNVNLPSGTYDIKIFTYDSYSNRVNATQPQEQSFLSLRDSSGEITKTGNTVDLEDKVVTATQVTTFNNVSVDRSVTKLVGVHAFYANNEANSHNFECVKLTKEPDEEEPDDLTGVCEVSPNRVETGESVTFSSDASDGTSPYSFSWDLENSSDDDNTQNVTTSYSTEGTFDGTVTITDDSGDEITRTCSVRVEDGGGGGGGPKLPPRDDDPDDDVRGDRDVNFGVQCLPDRSTRLVGEMVTYTATIDSDDIDADDVDFDWSGQSGIDEDGDTATIQYRSTGIKELRVEAEYDGETESDTCFVQIGRGEGVTLDQVPYTGPGDMAKTIGFITTLLLIALAGGYTIIRRREEDGIPVGIPTKQE